MSREACRRFLQPKKNQHQGFFLGLQRTMTSRKARCPFLVFCVFLCFFLKLQKTTRSGKVCHYLRQCIKKKDKDKACLSLFFALVS